MKICCVRRIIKIHLSGTLRFVEFHFVEKKTSFRRIIPRGMEMVSNELYTLYFMYVQ